MDFHPLILFPTILHTYFMGKVTYSLNGATYCFVMTCNPTFIPI